MKNLNKCIKLQKKKLNKKFNKLNERDKRRKGLSK